MSSIDDYQGNLEVKLSKFLDLKYDLASKAQAIEINATFEKMSKTYNYELEKYYPIDALSDNYDLVYFSLFNKPNCLHHPSHTVKRNNF